MDTFKISKTSWHYRLATTYTPIRGVAPDLCSYTRQVVIGLIIAFLLTVAGVLLGIMALDPILYFYVMWTIGYPGEMHAPGICGTIVYGIGGGYCMSYWLGGKIVDLMAHSRAMNRNKRLLAIGNPLSPTESLPPKQPGFISQAYNSIKNKFCIKVEVE